MPTAFSPKGHVSKPEVRQRIDQICLESGLPFLDIGEENRDSVYPLWNDRKIFCDLVNHLIEVHHKHKIYCLTGPPEQHQSRNRVLGFRDAMQQHGLPVSEQMIFYGDFWVHSGEQLGMPLQTAALQCRKRWHAPMRQWLRL
ncbi:MAG: hypothetical protein ACLR5S_03915 [Ruminococcus sp.]